MPPPSMAGSRPKPSAATLPPPGPSAFSVSFNHDKTNTVWFRKVYLWAHPLQKIRAVFVCKIPFCWFEAQKIETGKIKLDTGFLHQGVH